MSESTDLINCEVTGEPVPADETVVLHGKRVGARGKQILLERLETGQKIGDHAEPPSFGQRFGGSFLDGLIVGLFNIVLGLAAAASGLLANLGADAVRAGAIIQLIAVGVGVAYFALQHGKSGQTAGKRAAKTRALNLDGSPMSMGTAFVRAFAFAGVQGITALVLLIGGTSVVTVVGMLNLAVGVYGLANAITVLATKDKRALHDMIAGTRVVRIDN